MKITRFNQSCLLIEEGVARFAIDPSGDEATAIQQFGKLDAVLYTHEHSDHFDPTLAQQFNANGAKIYVNAATARQLNFDFSIVENGQQFEVGGVKIKVIELPHCLMPNGDAGPQNTGFLIADKLFNPGDGVEVEGLEVENLILPITGPDISMKDAFMFAKRASAKKVIPVHYDKLGAKPEVYAAFAARLGFDFEFKVLAQSESLEL